MSDINIETGSETWNNAKGFSAYHVLFPLIECRQLVTVCLFGVTELGQEMQYPKAVIKQNRINALYRLHEELKQIVQDNLFIMDKTRKKVMDDFLVKLNEIEPYLEKIYTETIDDTKKTSDISINEKLFIKILNILRSILSEIKKPLNDKNLIFPASDIYDIEAIKKEIIEEG